MLPVVEGLHLVGILTEADFVRDFWKGVSHESKAIGIFLAMLVSSFVLAALPAVTDIEKSTRYHEGAKVRAADSRAGRVPPGAHGGAHDREPPRTLRVRRGRGRGRRRRKTGSEHGHLATRKTLRRRKHWERVSWQLIRRGARPLSSSAATAANPVARVLDHPAHSEIGQLGPGECQRGKPRSPA